MQKLNDNFPRDDYWKFLELVLILLGSPSRGIKFRQLDAYHSAQWISKGIDCHRIVLFNDHRKSVLPEKVLSWKYLKAPSRIVTKSVTLFWHRFGFHVLKWGVGQLHVRIINGYNLSYWKINYAGNYYIIDFLPSLILNTSIPEPYELYNNSRASRISYFHG